MSNLAERRVPAARGRLALVFLLILAWPASSNGHVLGDGYLFLAAAGASVAIRAELPLGSVSQAIGVGSLDDRNLADQFAAIQSYLAPRIEVASGQETMPISIDSMSIMPSPLGEFLVVVFRSHEFAASFEDLRFGYRLFFDEDPEHRGVLVLQAMDEMAQSSEEGVVVLIFTPQRPEGKLGLSSPREIEYGRSSIPGDLLRLLPVLAIAIAGAAVSAMLLTWFFSRRRKRGRVGEVGEREAFRPWSGLFLPVLGAILAVAGLSLAVAGIVPLRSEGWVPLEVRLDPRSPADPEVEFRAVSDAVYEVEVLEQLPRNRKQRGAMVADRKRRGYPNVRWSVRNPHGRVAAGTGARVNYAQVDFGNWRQRVMSTLLLSPLLPPAEPTLGWLVSGRPQAAMGIGRWRARAGQTYWMSSNLSAAADASPERIDVRFRLRRQSWAGVFRKQQTLLQAGLAAGLMGLVVGAVGLRSRARRRVTAA